MADPTVPAFTDGNGGHKFDRDPPAEIKIAVLGRSYGTLGILGRIWGRTSSDLPTIQPVRVFERYLSYYDRLIRVSLWMIFPDGKFGKLPRYSIFEPRSDGAVIIYDIKGVEAAEYRFIDENLGPIREELGENTPVLILGVKTTDILGGDCTEYIKRRLYGMNNGVSVKHKCNGSGRGFIIFDKLDIAGRSEKDIDDAFSIIIGSFVGKIMFAHGVSAAKEK